MSTHPHAARYPATILCPIDFTPFSRRALLYAVALAQPARAKVALLHVCSLPLPSVVDDDLPEWMPDGPCPTTQLAEALHRFAVPARAAELPLELLFREGDPADEIVAAAGTLGADLIVMGTHGRRGWRSILGSHAARVLRTAPCPVLTVSGRTAPAAEPAVRIERIVCAASGSEHSSATTAYASVLAAGLGAHLTVVHVSPPQARTAITLPAGLAGGRLTVEERAASEPPSSEILRSARDRVADLIVIGDAGPEPAGRLGSTAAEVRAEASCGVLTVGTPRLPLDPPRPQVTLARTRTSW